MISVEREERYFTTGEYTDKSLKKLHIIIFGYITANVIWLSFILIISEFEAWVSVIFWVVFQFVFALWLYGHLKFGSTYKIDKMKSVIYISGKQIPLSSIHYVEVVHFIGVIDSLAIGFINNKKKPVIIHTGGNKTFDILEFCNILRELKGWDKMACPKYYGSQWFGYRKWKKEVKNDLLKKIE